MLPAVAGVCLAAALAAAQDRPRARDLGIMALPLDEVRAILTRYRAQDRR